MSEPMQRILHLYRERAGDPGFWAEPINALTNVSFLIAAGLALRLAMRRKAATPITMTLILLAGVIGIGSFIFHTAAGPVTMWVDVIPIALFQVLFLWLVCRRMLELNEWMSAGMIAVVLGLSFALMPIRQPLNGSLFYVPSLVAMLLLGGIWTAKGTVERFVLLGAAACFGLAITARAVDWDVPWSIGSHFFWHLLNGVVVYLGLRAWIVFVANKSKGQNPSLPLPAR